MMDKITLLLGSIRFWIVTLGLVSAILASVADGTFSVGALFDLLKAYFIAVVAIGTLDSVAKKAGEAARPQQ